MIIRGTTPTMTFGFPFDVEMIEFGYVVVKQNNETVIERLISDCEYSGKILSMTLTQEESLKLIGGVLAEIKIVAKTEDGERLETRNPISEYVVDTYKDGVI